MGISGLLPLLKSIHVTKHLSEFAGQTIGVDAYVWLHRGIHTCAFELATGKETHRYVDYAMHRVRLLRHHNIEPYIVFDGGPLPAKKKTEDDRKQRRDESLARGNALAAQGKHSQARECYLKCVDVTPQMAFQFIKALLAESVSYVVAPYEADAQLAYLERVGLIDGILTEDSDLLVFGCRNTLFKLDAVANTVVSISRKDFGSVCSPGSDISLVGWSDTQFRAMAILSGCDYLPSIPGIGLKTACTLLRKWKTVEQVVKAVLLEGKKKVPKNYLEQFKLAEKCFLHQRVYCPFQEKLVHLNEVDADWVTGAEAYCGGDMASSVAKEVATGDLDPVSLLPIKDIHPRFTPHMKTRPLKTNPKTRVTKTTPSKEGILSFFGPNPKIPPRHSSQSLSPRKKVGSGKASGKRTLVEVMDSDMTLKKQKQKSKFFSSSPQRPRTKLPKSPKGPSQAHVKIIDDDDDDDEVTSMSCLSVQAQGKVDPEMAMDLEDPLVYKTVEQEDGYISPTSSYSGEIQDLSSPALSPDPIRTPTSKAFELDVEAISSPPSAAKQRSRPVLRTGSLDLPRLHRLASRPIPLAQASSWHAALPAEPFLGPDLRHSFNDEGSSDIDCSDDDRKDPALFNHSPVTPPMQENAGDTDDAQDSGDAREMRTHAVVTGWRRRWARGGRTKAERSNLSNLARRETNITPGGRHTIPHPDSRLRSKPYSRTTPNSASKATSKAGAKLRHAEGRRGLPFCEPLVA